MNARYENIFCFLMTLKDKVKKKIVHTLNTNCIFVLFLFPFYTISNFPPPPSPFTTFHSIYYIYELLFIISCWKTSLKRRRTNWLNPIMICEKKKDMN